MSDYKYKRVLLKLSGEALMGSRSFGIDPDIPQRIADELKPAYEAGVQIGVVIGGGNIFRGISGAAAGMDRAQGDNMGMLAIRRRAIRHLEKGIIPIFAAGTGNPFFTTDTAAALRACEINAEVLMKATKVDGIYDSDPVKNPDAVKFDTISYREVLKRNLNVMDSTATALCQDNHMPIMVFNLDGDGIFDRALRGEDVGSTVVDE